MRPIGPGLPAFLLLLLLAAPPVRAEFPALPEEATLACAHVPGLVTQPTPAPADEGTIYRRLLAFMESRSNVPTLAVLRASGTARWQQPTFTVTLNAGSGLRLGDQDWPNAWPLAFYTVIVRPLVPAVVDPEAGWLARIASGLVPPPFRAEAPPDSPAHPANHQARLARTAPPSAVAPGSSGRAAPGNLTLTLEFTPPPEAGWRERYEILVLPCLRPNAEDPRVFAINYGRIEVTLNHPLLGVAAALLVVLAIVFALGQAAARASPGRLTRPVTEGGQPRLLRNFLLGRFSPAFICQDTFGTMSLAVFQVFLFTLALLGVYTYAFVLTGSPPTVQPSVLALAGITLAGSALATAANRPVLEARNRLWLVSAGIISAPNRVPHWSDLLTSDGQIEISRVQALAFTLFAIAALVVRGAEDLDSFTIPEQLNYLLGLSQTFYVAGKALPAESARRLNDDVRALADAQADALARADRESWTRFDGLKRAVRQTLRDVFGERFDSERLRTLEPAGPPPA